MNADKLERLEIIQKRLFIVKYHGLLCITNEDVDWLIAELVVGDAENAKLRATLDKFADPKNCAKKI